MQDLVGPRSMRIRQITLVASPNHRKARPMTCRRPPASIVSGRNFAIEGKTNEIYNEISIT